MSDLALTILTSSAAATILGGAAAWLFKAWAGARIRGEVEAHYAKDLETHRTKLRAEADAAFEHFKERLDQHRSLRTAAHTAFETAHTAAAERRLKAVETAWESLIEFRDTASRLMGLIDIFTREEMQHALADPKSNEAIGNPTQQDMLSLLTKGRAVERFRPFVDEPFFAAVVGYQAVLGRILVKLEIGRKERRLTFWLDDEFERNLVATLLGDEELERIAKRRIGGIGEVSKAAELKIVELARRTVSGEAASEDAIRHARRVLEAVASLPKPPPPA